MRKKKRGHLSAACYRRGSDRFLMKIDELLIISWMYNVCTVGKLLDEFPFVICLDRNPTKKNTHEKTGFFLFFFFFLYIFILIKYLSFVYYYRISNKHTIIYALARACVREYICCFNPH